MNFHELEELQRFVRTLKTNHVDSLKHYHLRKSCGFNREFEFDTEKIHCSKASTATCVLSLTTAGLWTEKQALWYDQTDKLINELVAEQWTSAKLDENNPFTTSFLLECILALGELSPDSIKSESVQSKILTAKNILKESLSLEGNGNIKGSARIKDYPPSTYLTQIVVRVLLRCHELDADLQKSVKNWSWTQIEHELALIYSESKSADAFALGYAVLLFVSCSKSFEATPDQKHILSKAIDCFFSLQLPDGSWPRSRPLFHYPSVGNAYCFEYEFLTQFLQQKEMLEYSLKYLSQLSLAARRLKETAFEFEEGGFGWASGHHPQIAGPESWSTASVFHFLYNMDRLLAEAIRREVFNYVGAKYKTFTNPDPDISGFYSTYWDSEIKVTDEIKLPLRATLKDNFLLPISEKEQDVEKGFALPRDVPISAVLYGPPGTSKTSLAEEISESLKWPLLPIDPSHLSREGMEQVQAETNLIFNMLSKLERCVVLLDEFDEMLRERNGNQSETMSRFLTTAMLPKLSQISKERRIVFIVATNHIENFDFAIKRPGRFDMIVQVMPPTLSEKFLAFPDLKKYLLTTLKVSDESLKKYLEPLTHDEFISVKQNLLEAENSDKAIRLMEDAFERCTLQQKVKNEENKISTLKELCDDQAHYNRIPGYC